MALSVSCTCCALVSASADCCGYLCYPSAVLRLWPLWSNSVPLSLIRCTLFVPLFLGCCVICHMVLIALKRRKVLRLPLRSYHLYNRISQFRFDNLDWRGLSHLLSSIGSVDDQSPQTTAHSFNHNPSPSSSHKYSRGMALYWRSQEDWTNLEIRLWWRRFLMAYSCSHLSNVFALFLLYLFFTMILIVPLSLIK